MLKLIFFSIYVFFKCTQIFAFQLEVTSFSKGLKEGTEQTLFSIKAMEGKNCLQKISLATGACVTYTVGAAITATAVYYGLSTASGTESQIKNSKRVFEALLKGYGGYQIHRLQKKLGPIESNGNNSIEMGAKSNDIESPHNQGSNSMDLEPGSGGIRNLSYTPTDDEMVTDNNDVENPHNPNSNNMESNDNSLKTAFKFTLPSAFREGAETGFTIGTVMHNLTGSADGQGLATALATSAGSAFIGSAIPLATAATVYGLYKLSLSSKCSDSCRGQTSKVGSRILDSSLGLLKWTLWAGAAHETMEIINADPRIYKIDKSYAKYLAPLTALTPFSLSPDPLQMVVGLYGVWDVIVSPLLTLMKSKCLGI